MLERDFKHLLKYAHLAAPAVDQKPFRKAMISFLETLPEKDRAHLQKRQTKIGVKLAIDMYEMFKNKGE